MTIVLDVSAAVEIILQKEKKDLFVEKVAESSLIIAPDLYVSEISNVFWKYHRSKAFSYTECIQFVDDGIQLIDDFFEAKVFWKEALNEGIKHNHSIYDMYYAVLARRNAAMLLTNDKILASLAKSLKIDVCT